MGALGHGRAIMRRTSYRRRSRSARHWAAPFVLAMLGLRAFVPAGFMLAPVEGRLAVVLCDSDAQRTAQHHGGHDHSGHHHTHPDPTCPYAQSAGPAPLPALPSLGATPLAGSRELPAQGAQTYSRFGPERHLPPRAPPYLA